jgi:triacylglycerol esterase/lipase EstA (alpha/beta hydrolase family)
MPLFKDIDVSGLIKRFCIVTTAAALGAVASFPAVAAAGSPAGAGSSATAASPAARYPVVYSFAAGLAAALASPGAAPPGANNWACKPSAAHQYPVVLVHGTGANMTDSWQALSALLANNGYCVFALNYGGGASTDLLQGYGDIPTSATELGTFVNQVLGATGAAKVDMVGHSQGGMMPRYYLGFLGGAGKVHRLVGLAPSNHGTDLDGLTQALALFPGGTALVGAACPACAQQIVGSPFMATLNSIGDTVPGVAYTVIETRYDEIVTPYTTALLNGSAVTNIILQNQCALDFVDHIGIGYDPIALRDVLNALDPAHAVSPLCVFVPPVLG